MNQITQHIPAFVDTDEPPEQVTFSTLEALRAVLFVKHFVDSEGFVRLSVAGNALMAESNNGRTWWVIGFLKSPVDGLPDWDGGVYDLIDKTGNQIEVSGRDVVSSWGDEVMLRDGRVLKNARPK